MSELPRKSITLVGRLQIRTARDALLHSGLSETTAEHLTFFLDNSEKMTLAEPNKRLGVRIRGNNVEKIMAEIIFSLDLYETSLPESSEEVIAVKALSEYLSESSTDETQE